MCTTAESVAPISREDAAAVFELPLLELVFRAAEVHRRNHDPSEVQCSALLSIKTGACPEDCAYCPQSAHHSTGLKREPLLPLREVVERAKRAQADGADRFCMGAAWRGVTNGPEFERVLEMVTAVKTLGLETCVTLGMIDGKQAVRLKAAGLDYYNHNLDTSPEYYGEIISTRTYDQRLETLRAVRESGMSVCCGGIVGMGETDDDRIGLLHALASQDPQPESVPINTLIAVDGTPLAKQAPLDWSILVRMVATARVLMPSTVVRLSAGRMGMNEAVQAMCFLAGANSIFLGDRLLTTPNPGPDGDHALLTKLGLSAQSQKR